MTKMTGIFCLGVEGWGVMDWGVMEWGVMGFFLFGCVDFGRFRLRGVCRRLHVRECRWHKMWGLLCVWVLR